MKYKIYCHNKEYKVPSATVYGYGDVFPIKLGEDVAVRLWDGDIAYLKKDYDESNDDYFCLYFATESGAIMNVHYFNLDRDSHSQASVNGWLCTGIIFQEYGDFIRIYNTGMDSGGRAEEECRKHGKLVGIFQFTTDEEGNEIWRMIDPTIVKYNGQWIELPRMNDRLFISSVACTSDGLGYYYVFESGSEGLGLIVDHDDLSVYGESYEGWFGGYYPREDRDLYIYHCGEGFYDHDWYASINDYFDFDEMNSFFLSQNIQPTILRYNEDTERWYLVQEGTRYDY